MKNSILYLILSLTISSCSQSIVRAGNQTNKSEYTNCEIVIKKHMSITDSMQKVGEIELGESGLSEACSENDAIEILRNMGCALNVNIINITNEKRSDLMSSCYSCRAEFYRLTIQKKKVENDEKFKPEIVNDRISNDNRKNSGLVMIVGIVGVIIGYFLL